MTTPLTTHFGLTRVGEGEPLSKNGWAALDLDRVKLDDLLQALVSHRHTGEDPLGDPTDAPGLNAVPTGGHLSADTTFYYRVSFVDKYGLETGAGPEESITTPAAISPPSAPSATIESSSGTLAPGTYSYIATYYDAYGGETTPSSLNAVQVTTGTTNRIRLDFGTLPDGVVGIRVYRSRPGQSQFYFLGNLTSGSFYDQGQAEDQTILVNTTNTTNSANAVEVTIPLGFVPPDVASWRIYRASESGGYDGNSLVHDVTEGLTDTSTIPRTVWVDTGEPLLAGFPLETSQTIGDGTLLTLGNLSGSLPLATTPRGAQCLSAFASSTITNNETILVTEAPSDVKPVRLTAYFKTPPSSSTQVTFRLTDGGGTYVQLVCPVAVQSGDPTGYYHYEWPLVENQIVYASDGATVTVSDGTQVGLITDQVSDTGQSMLLENSGEWVQGNLDIVDAGTYNAFASVRTNENTTSTGDVRIDVIRLDTSASIANAVITVTSQTNFSDTAPLSFTAPGGVDLAIRVTKLTSAVQTYLVQDVRFHTDVPTLNAGRLTLSALVTGTANAADANLVLWF